MMSQRTIIGHFRGGPADGCEMQLRPPDGKGTGTVVFHRHPGDGRPFFYSLSWDGESDAVDLKFVSGGFDPSPN